MVRRWPWLRWRLQGWGDLPIGSETFRFVDVAQPAYAWWAQMVRRGEWETATIARLEQSLRPDDVFFDIGGFVGAYTLLASRLVGRNGRVVSFEPDPRPRLALERNLAANAVINVTVLPYAVGATPGKVRFAASGRSIGHVSTDGSIEVPQVTLDGICKELGLKPTVMKVDIEGGEASALAGSNTVRALRELVLEVHQPQLVAQGVNPRAFLRDLGPYELLEPADKGNYAVAFRPAP
jgi:FkbM family methyltransferase